MDADQSFNEGDGMSESCRLGVDHGEVREFRAVHRVVNVVRVLLDVTNEFADVFILCESR